MPIGTNEFFPQLIRLAAKRKAPTVPTVQQPEGGRRDQSAASSELFLSFTRRSFPTGTRDGGRRQSCEPQPCSLGEWNVRRDLAAVAIPWHVQESLPLTRFEKNCTHRPRRSVLSIFFVDLLCRSAVLMARSLPGTQRNKKLSAVFLPSYDGYKEPRRNPPSSPAGPATFTISEGHPRGASGTRREACT